MKFFIIALFAALNLFASEPGLSPLLAADTPPKSVCKRAW